MSYAKHPKEMYMLALVEMCQRFAFWGVGNLLVLYLVLFHKFPDMRADNLYGFFTGVAFVLPVLGGFFADRMGYRLPVYAGALATAAGCFLLATGSLHFLYAALILVAIGASIFTPSIYALLGHVYHDKQHLREGGFSIYYCSVNVGIFLAMFTLGFIGQSHSWSLAFTLAGIIQLLGIWPFARVMKSPALANLDSIQEQARLSKRPQAPLTRTEKSRLWVIGALAFFSIFFWVAYNQGGSSLTLFSLRYTDRNLFGFEMPAAWLYSAEPLYLVLLAIPLTSLYIYLHKRKKDPTPPVKSALGLIFMALCFGLMALGSRSLPPLAQSGSVSPLYLLGSYFLMAVGELLITPIGLALITHLSPRRYTALLVGVWYLCIGIGYYLGGVLAGLMSVFQSISQFFNLYILISLIPALALLLFARKLNAMRHLK
jgi:POT family proton-dependent oligopeptide transporter